MQVHKKILGARIRELPRYENLFRIFHFPSKGSYRFAEVYVICCPSKQDAIEVILLTIVSFSASFDVSAFSYFAFSYFAFSYFVYVLAKRKRSVFATVQHDFLRK